MFDPSERLWHFHPTVQKPLWKGCRSTLWVAGICLPAVLPLLWRPHAEFGPDWGSHLFAIGYQSHFFRHHHWFSETLNTDWLTGMPYPIFYAFIFYPVAALLAALIGADWAVRLIAIGLLATQTWQVRKLLQAAGGMEKMNWLAAAMLSWATYSLTNLYTRGAIAEFVAVSLLVSATASLLRSALPGELGTRGRLAFQGAFLYALSAGSHPITALFGTLFLACLLPAVFVTSWRKLLLPLLAGGCVAVLMLAPWLYLVGKFRGTLTVERQGMKQVVHFTDSIDSIQSRLWPWPRDIRVGQGKPVKKVSTPYLDAQISLPLLILAASVFLWSWGQRKEGGNSDRTGLCIVGMSWGIFSFTIVLSVWPAPWRWLPNIFQSVQFAYRLVNYQNLALLTALTGALLAVPLERRETWRPGGRWKELGLWLAALTGLGVMLTHAFTVQHGPSRDYARRLDNPDNYVQMSLSFYGWPAYSILGENAETNQPVHPAMMAVGTGEFFGLVLPTRFELDTPTNVCLQVQPFPWNKVFLDREPLDEARVRTRPEGYAVELAAGTHGLTFRWEPDPAWVWLDLLSKFTTLGGGLTVIALAIRERRYLALRVMKVRSDKETII
jgi:hypothetical protein